MKLVVPKCSYMISNKDGNKSHCFFLARKKINGKPLCGVHDPKGWHRSRGQRMPGGLARSQKALRWNTMHKRQKAMETVDTEALIEARAQALKAIRLEKGSAYAIPSDPYMNYRVAGGRKYAVRRAMEKLARLIQRLETGKPVGIEEFGDAINILYIAWIWPDVYKDEKP